MMADYDPRDHGYEMYKKEYYYRETFMPEFGHNVWQPMVFGDGLSSPEPYVTKSQCLAFLRGVEYGRSTPMKDSKREALEAAVEKTKDAWHKARDAWDEADNACRKALDAWDKARDAYGKAKKELEEYIHEGQ